MCFPGLELYRVESASRNISGSISCFCKRGNHDSECKLVRIGASISLLSVLAGTPGLANGIRV